MTNMSPVSEQYPESPEDLRLQRIGARLILMKLLAEVQDGWNGYGTRLWARRQLEELDE